MMFTKTDLEKLLQFKSRDAVSAAVSRIPEEEEKGYMLDRLTYEVEPILFEYPE